MVEKSCLVVWEGGGCHSWGRVMWIGGSTKVMPGGMVVDRDTQQSRGDTLLGATSQILTGREAPSARGDMRGQVPRGAGRRRGQVGINARSTPSDGINEMLPALGDMFGQ